MKNKIADTDYLYASARIRSLERFLLTRERLMLMCDAKTNEDAAKILSECGWSDFSVRSFSDIEAAIASERQRFLDDLLGMAPDRQIVDAFLTKYDYHNLKTIIKGEAAGETYEHLFIDIGTIPSKDLVAMLREDNLDMLPEDMREAANEAKDVLARTKDPQLCDFVLDKACFSSMLQKAEKTGSLFLFNYIRLQIDSINLRSLVRNKRMERGAEYLQKCLIEGGQVSVDSLLKDTTPSVLKEAFEKTPLNQASVIAGECLAGTLPLTNLELSCENALIQYVKNTKYQTFGNEVFISYLVLKENELTAVRTIMAGRLAALPAEKIMEKLRDVYA